MKHVFYTVTDWVYFLSDVDEKKIKDILTKREGNEDVQDPIQVRDYVTWRIIAVLLPLITYILAFLLNILTNEPSFKTFYSNLNNGSLPIISFGIITSGIPYLMEKMDENDDDYLGLRQRVMAIALIFLFLSSSLYIFQTQKITSDLLDSCTNFIVLIFSVFIFIASSSIGNKMFLLQSKKVKDYFQRRQDNITNLYNSTEDI